MSNDNEEQEGEPCSRGQIETVRNTPDNVIRARIAARLGIPLEKLTEAASTPKS